MFYSTLLPSFVFSQEFEGNFERHSAIGNTLNPPITARYIKVKPKTWNGRISLRVELYGCYDGMYNSVISRQFIPSLQYCHKKSNKGISVLLGRALSCDNRAYSGLDKQSLQEAPASLQVHPKIEIKRTFGKNY